MNKKFIFSTAFTKVHFSHCIEIEYDTDGVYKNDPEASMDHLNDLRSTNAYDNPYIILDGIKGKQKYIAENGKYFTVIELSEIMQKFYEQQHFSLNKSYSFNDNMEESITETHTFYIH